MKTRRNTLKYGYQNLHEEVLRAVRGADPIGLDPIGAPADEYAPEVGKILPRLRTAQSDSDVARIVHEEFARWFAADFAGSESKYVDVGSAIWKAWRSHRDRELAP